MRRSVVATALIAAVAMTAAAISGCAIGLGPGPGTKNASVTVTRDFGSQSVGVFVQKHVPGAETVMQLLQRGFKVSNAYGGGFVLLYHLLWELTHVCFEHPGLLSAQRRAADEDADCTDVVCITCSDEGRLAEVVATGPGYNARVRTAAGIESIDTTLIGTPRPGSLVLVHAGSAVSTIED